MGVMMRCPGTLGLIVYCMDFDNKPGFSNCSDRKDNLYRVCAGVTGALSTRKMQRNVYIQYMAKSMWTHDLPCRNLEPCVSLSEMILKVICSLSKIRTINYAGNP